MIDAPADDGLSPWRDLDELRPRLRRYLRYHRGCRRDDVDDVVSETLIRVARYRHRRMPGRAFVPWVQVVATRTLYDWIRRKSRHECPTDEENVLEDVPDLHLAPDAIDEDQWVDVGTFALDRRVALSVMRRSIDQLRPRDQAALLAHYYEGGSCAGIAADAGQTVGSVKARLHAARQRLVVVMRRELGLLPPSEREFSPVR